MRLIDADAILHTHKIEQEAIGKDWGVDDLAAAIMVAETVEAIPVEWLRNFAKERFEKPVLDLLWYWQKEQEEMKDAAN